MTLTLAGPVPARIHMNHGEVVHAARGDEVGESALKSILRMPSGTLQTNTLESEEATISRSFQSLLLDMLRALDEQSKSSALPTGLDSLFSSDFSSTVPAAIPEIPPSQGADRRCWCEGRHQRRRSGGVRGRRARCWNTARLASCRRRVHRRHSSVCAASKTTGTTLPRDRGDVRQPDPRSSVANAAKTWCSR